VNDDPVPHQAFDLRVGLQHLVELPLIAGEEEDGLSA
jgi:hypothetical protein